MVATRRSEPERVAQHVIAEEHADLVAPQRSVAVAVGDRGAQPIGVGIARDQHVRLHARRLGEREVESTGFLRVGECHRREVGIGIGLRGDDVQWRESRLRQHTDDLIAPDTVHRGVHDRRVAAPSARATARPRRAGRPRRCRFRAGSPRDRRVTRAAPSTVVPPRRSRPRSRRRQAARSVRRRRGTPCNRCQREGCGWRSPSPPRRNRDGARRTRATGSAAAAAGAARANPRPRAPQRCPPRTRRTCAGRRTR